MGSSSAKLKQQPKARSKEWRGVRGWSVGSSSARLKQMPKVGEWGGAR